MELGSFRKRGRGLSPPSPAAGVEAILTLVVSMASWPKKYILSWFMSLVQAGGKKDSHVVGMYDRVKD